MSGCHDRAWSCCLAGPWAPRGLLQGPLVTFQWMVGYATETPTATVRPHSVLSPLHGHPTAPSDGAWCVSRGRALPHFGVGFAVRRVHTPIPVPIQLWRCSSLFQGLIFLFPPSIARGRVGGGGGVRVIIFQVILVLYSEIQTVKNLLWQRAFRFRILRLGCL